MQHGSARPLAVKYITVHGRRHSDHGEPDPAEPLSLRLRLTPGSDAPPDALKVDAERVGERGGAVDMDRFLARKLLVERLVRPRHADGVVLEEDQPLQMHFLDAGLGGDTDEVRQFLDGFAQAGEPGRNPRLEVALALLQLAEGAHVFQDAIEVVLAANGEIGLRIRRVERDAQLVQLGGDQRAAVFLIEHRAVGVEQNIGAAILQITHHARQMLHQHRLADAMQHGAFRFGI